MDDLEQRVLAAAVTGATMVHGKDPTVSDVADDVMAITAEVMARILAAASADWLAYYSTFNAKELEKEAKRLRKIVHDAGPDDDITEAQARLVAVESLLMPSL